MINKWIGMGHLTREPEMETTGNGNSYLRFTLAVDRNYTDRDGERQADFINCVAWRQTAEFIATYFHKGSMIAVEAELQTRTYDDNNNVTHYITEAIVSQASFTGEKSTTASSGTAARRPDPVDDEAEDRYQASRKKSTYRNKR